MDAEGKIVVFEGRYRDDKDHYSVLEKSDLFLFDISSQSVHQISKGVFLRRAKHPSLSADGRYMAFIMMQNPNFGSDPGVIIYDLESDKWKRLATGVCSSPVISSDGSVIAYEKIEERRVSKRKKEKVRNLYVVENSLKEKAP
jgi:Tol biopolymer transport system component